MLDHEQAGLQSWPLGEGLARYFLHDIIRAIDYMSTRTEIDPKRIGITGNSGGGLQTGLAMICDDRIAAAAPGTFISSRASILYSGIPQDAEQIWPGMAGAGFDHTDILLAFAPRPLMVLAVTDDFFPIDGTQTTVEEARRYWIMYGKENDLILAEDESDHQYTEKLANNAAAFFASSLLVNNFTPYSTTLQLLAPKALHCTVSGQVKLNFTHARAVYDENLDRLNDLEQIRLALSAKDRIYRGKQWLQGKVYNSQAIVAANPRQCNSWKLEEHHLSVSGLIWFAQEHMLNHALVFRADSYNGTELLPITIGLWEGGTSRLEENLSWIKKTCFEGRIAMILNVTGEGSLEPYSVYHDYGIKAQFGTLHKFNKDLFGLEDSLAAIRIFDVSQAMKVAKRIKGVDSSDIALYVKGSFSFYGALAKFLDGDSYSFKSQGKITSIAELIRK